MPYRIDPGEGGTWNVMHETAPGKWEVKARHKTRRKAILQLRLLLAIEHGKPIGLKKA